MAPFSAAIEGENSPIANEPLVYRGDKIDLPAFLPGFVIPVPQAWFDVLFKKGKENKKTVYKDNAYRVETGYIVYDCKEAYEAEFWVQAMKTVKFAVQVEWAQSSRTKAKAKHGLMEVSIFKPDAYRKALRKERGLMTTQHQFVRFLRSDKFADLKGTDLCDNTLKEEERTELK